MFFSAKTYCELYSFALAPHVLPNDHPPRHQLSLPVASILSLSALQLVLIVTSQPGALLLSKMLDNLGGQGVDPVMSALKIDSPEIHCVAARPSSNKYTGYHL